MQKFKMYRTVVDSSADLGDNSSLKMIFNLVENESVVLDVGCSSGYLGKLLKEEKYCTVVGVDINSQNLCFLENYYDKFLVADLDVIPLSVILSDYKFDVIVFGDVLEHLRNPWMVLENVHNIIKENGYVMASIPNIAHGSIVLSLLEGNFNYSQVGILDDTHLRFFTRSSCIDLFSQSGFFAEIVNCTKIHYLEKCDLFPTIDEKKYIPEILELVENSQDADVLQFIIRAFPNLQTQLKTYKHELEQYKKKLQTTQQELQTTQQELEQKQKEVRYMERSKFWKLRNLWHKIKKTK